MHTLYFKVYSHCGFISGPDMAAVLRARGRLDSDSAAAAESSSSSKLAPDDQMQAALISSMETSTSSSRHSSSHRSVPKSVSVVADSEEEDALLAALSDEAQDGPELTDEQALQRAVALSLAAASEQLCEQSADGSTASSDIKEISAPESVDLANRLLIEPAAGPESTR